MGYRTNVRLFVSLAAALAAAGGLSMAWGAPKEPPGAGRAEAPDESARLERESAKLLEDQRRDAERGNADAQVYYGMYFANTPGAAKSWKTAVFWYLKAAQQGSAEAEYDLGDAYERGMGVRKDDGQAAAWYRLAADQDYAPIDLDPKPGKLWAAALAQRSESKAKWGQTANPLVGALPIVWGDRGAAISVRGLSADRQGSLYLIGDVPGDSGARSVRIWKFDGAGKEQPGYPKELVSTMLARGESVAAAADGSVYAAGSIGDYHMALWKLEPDGKKAWRFPVYADFNFNLPGHMYVLPEILEMVWTYVNGQDYRTSAATAVAVDAEGSVWVAGYVRAQKWRASDKYSTRRLKHWLEDAPQKLAVWKYRPNGELFEGFPKTAPAGDSPEAASFATQIAVAKNVLYILGHVHTNKEVSTRIWNMPTDGSSSPRPVKTIFTRQTDEMEPVELSARSEHLISPDRSGSLWWIADPLRDCSVGKLDAAGATAPGYPKPFWPCGDAIAAGGGDVWLFGLETKGREAAWRLLPDGTKDFESIVRWKPDRHDSVSTSAGAAADDNGFVWFGGELWWGTKRDLFAFRLDPTELRKPSPR